VDEQADHRLDTRQRSRPSGDGHAENDVLFAAVAAEQQGPGSLQKDVHRQLAPARERSQSRRSLDRELDPPLGIARFAPRFGTIEMNAYQRRRRRKPLEKWPPEVLGVRLLLLAQPRNVVLEWP